jgi:hypothetical protein
LGRVQGNDNNITDVNRAIYGFKRPTQQQNQPLSMFGGNSIINSNPSNTSYNGNRGNIGGRGAKNKSRNNH